jgi:two-component system, sensor histidine kinase and response regulator
MGDLRYRGTVLVVEDSDEVLEPVRDGLRAHGYRVLAVHDGLKALTMLASTPVDVIVLDLSMPIMTGWEFLDARSADPLLASIPVVVISGVANAVDGPWNALVAKPFGIEQLVAAIEKCRRPPPRRNTPSALPRH